MIKVICGRFHFTDYHSDESDTSMEQLMEAVIQDDGDDDDDSESDGDDNGDDHGHGDGDSLFMDLSITPLKGRF